MRNAVVRPPARWPTWALACGPEGPGSFRDGVRAPARRRYGAPMPLEGEYEASSWDWVHEQVEEFEASGGQRDRAVAVYSEYQAYQDATERRIPVFVTRRQ